MADDLVAGSRRTADRSVLQSVQRAARVLDEIARRRGPVTIADIAASLKLDRTIVYRLVKTLEGEALLEQSGVGYTMGPRALLFGNAYLDNLSVLRVALPYQVGMLDRLLKGRPWTTHIEVPISSELALVDTVWNVDAPLDIQLSLGRRFPMATTAGGHAILAFRGQAEIEAAVGTDVASSLAEDLQRIRDAHGLAFVRDFVPGVSAIAAVIFNRGGTPIAALLLAGLELEEHLTPTSEVAMTVKRTADAISQMLP